MTEDEQKVRGGREKIYRREKNTGSKEGQGTYHDPCGTTLFTL